MFWIAVAKQVIFPLNDILLLASLPSPKLSKNQNICFFCLWWSCCLTDLNRCLGIGEKNYVSLLLKSKGGLLAASREMTHLGTCHSAWIPMGCTGDMSLLNYWIPLCSNYLRLLAWFLIGWHLWALLNGPSCVSHLYAIFLDWTFCLLPSQVWASLSYETNSTCWETAAKRL